MTNINTIPKNLLRKFIIHRKLSGTVSFLRYLQKKGQLKDFCVFCEANGYNPQLSLQLPLGILFHGSRELRSVLIPNISIGRHSKAENRALLYATDDPNYAIFLAILNLRNGGASVKMTGKKPVLTVDLDFVNGPSKIKDGYVHIISSKSFKKTRNKEYVADTSVKVLFIVPVTFKDLTAPTCIQSES